MIYVTDNTFEEIVVKSGLPIMVDFWAEWCGPCKAVMPILEELSKEYKTIRFASVNVEESREATSKCGVTSLPTIVVFKDGGLVYASQGLKSKEALREIIEDVLEE